jgi:leucyl-tRNA synthetase
MCEEVWSDMGKAGFISMAEWPRADESKVDALAEERENLLTDLIEDTLNVLKATKITPTRICYYTAATWKRKVYRNILTKAMRGEVKVNEVMKELAKDSALKENMKAVAAFVPRVLKTLNKLPSDRKARIAQVEIGNEKEIIEDAAVFLKERFNAQVTVYSEEDTERYDPKQRATMAMPYQPAIYVE